MLELTNPDLFAEVVEQAKHKTLGDPRWIHAIERAASEILSNPFMEWMGAHMLIQSPKSSEVYEAGGSCQCPAYGFHRACWHRAAYKLFRRYLEALAAQPRAPQRQPDIDAPLIPARRKTERCGAFQI